MMVSIVLTKAKETPLTELPLRKGVFVLERYSVKNLSVSLRSTAPLVGEPLAGRATSYWTPEARYGAKGRALLQRAAASGQAHLVKLP